MTTTATIELVLVTDGGSLPYAALTPDNPYDHDVVLDNMIDLGMRFVRAGLVAGFNLEAVVETRFDLRENLAPKLLLSEGLAIAEGRFPRPYTEWWRSGRV